jgi:hypothetical protein
MTNKLAGSVILVLTLVGHGCSHAPTAPTGPTPAPSVAAATPAPTVSSLAITGGVSFSAIGETRQLTATATYSDQTIRNVTTEVQWRSLAPAMFAVSPSGVVTVVGFGVTNIQGSLGTRMALLQVSATPPNTSAFYGRVREPGNSGIAGVRVSETQSGKSTLTDAEGSFSIAGLTSAHLAFEKEDFEPVQIDARPSIFNDASLQRIIRVTAGDTVTPLQLAPHDMSDMVGADRCYPCRLIRVVSATAGTLHLTLTWTGGSVGLNLWADGRLLTGKSPELATDLAVSAGEAVVYVGMILPANADGASSYVPFKLATTIRSGP